MAGEEAAQEHAAVVLGGDGQADEKAGRQIADPVAPQGDADQEEAGDRGEESHGDIG